MWTSAIIGMSISWLILWLVRKDRLHSRYAMWWLLIALIIAVIGIFPVIVDTIAGQLGIFYPPILPVILGMGFILIKLLHMDIERSRNEIKIHRLAQRLAILEAELKTIENKQQETQ